MKTQTTFQNFDLNKIPEDLYIPKDAFKLTLESFSGPMDLLLYLIHKKDVDILDINVAEIVESIDGPIAITACLDESDDLCNTQSICLLSGNWNKANNAILEALRSVSLIDLLNTEDFLKPQNTDTAVLHT